MRGGVLACIWDKLLIFEHFDEACKLVPTQTKLLMQAGGACKPGARPTCKSRKGSADVVVRGGDVLVVKEDAAAVEVSFSDSDVEWKGAKNLKYLSATGVVLQVHERSVELEHEDKDTQWWPYGALMMHHSKTGEDRADTSDVQFVTGVALETEVGEMEELQKQLRSMREKKLDEEQNMTFPTLAGVGNWSTKQLAEASIAKFREPPQKAPSLPQGVVPLSSFICPIGMDLMSDPVSTADGMTFERCHIAKWFKTVPLCVSRHVFVCVYVSSCALCVLCVYVSSRACSRYTILFVIVWM